MVGSIEKGVLTIITFPEEIMFVNDIIWTEWANTDKISIPTVWAITYVSFNFNIFFKENSKTPFLKTFLSSISF